MTNGNTLALDACPPLEACQAALSEHLKPEIFRALCDPTRLAVVGRLAAAAGALTVTEISDCCGVHISGVSRHLATLRGAGVIHGERVGREVRYRLECDHLITLLRGLADALEVCRASCCTDPPGHPGESHDP